jgi:hypothetical protein
MLVKSYITNVVLIVAVIFAGRTQGGDRYWQVSLGNWSMGSNWTSGEPYSGDWAYIDNGGTACIDQSGEVCRQLRLGQNSGANGTVRMFAGDLTVTEREHIGFNGRGRFEQTGGTHSAGLGDDPNFAGLYLGYNTDSDGVYVLTAGQIEAENEFVGFDGNGVFLHVDGDNLVARDLHLGHGSGSYGQYVQFAVTSNLMGGFAVKCTTIGYEGKGVFKHYNGTHMVGGNLKLGAEYGSDGTYNLHDGTLSADSEYIGYSGTGYFTQYGGKHDVNSDEVNYGDLYVGYAFDGNGTYHLDGGELFAENQYIGYDGQGHFLHTGGDNLVKYDMYIGYGAGSHGQYIYDAAVTSNLMGGFAVKCTTIGYEGTGIFEHYGGTHTVRGGLILGRESSSSGTYQMSDGILQVEGDLEVGRSGNGILETTGGTIDVFSDSNDATLRVSGVNCQSGRLNLYGGIITANNLYIHDSNGVIDIQGDGALVIDGNSLDLIDQYISSGLITSYDGLRPVEVDYNDINPGKTTIGSGQCPIGDLIGDDCFVNFKDLGVLANTWLKDGMD